MKLIRLLQKLRCSDGYLVEELQYEYKEGKGRL